MEKEERRTKTGAAAAAVLSASLGSFVLGMATLLAEGSSAIKAFLNWWELSGPLSGKSGAALLIWLISWLGLHFVWRNRNPSLPIVLSISFFLLGLAILMTFPPIFELFQ